MCNRASQSLDSTAVKGRQMASVMEPHIGLLSRHISAQSYPQMMHLLLGTEGRTIFPVHFVDRTESPCNLHPASLLSVTAA